MKRILLYALLVLLLAGGVFVTKLIWGRPFNFDHLLERYLIAFVKDQPAPRARAEPRLARDAEFSSEAGADGGDRVQIHGVENKRGGAHAAPGK